MSRLLSHDLAAGCLFLLVKRQIATFIRLCHLDAGRSLYRCRSTSVARQGHAPTLIGMTRQAHSLGVVILPHASTLKGIDRLDPRG